MARCERLAEKAAIPNHVGSKALPEKSMQEHRVEGWEVGARRIPERRAFERKRPGQSFSSGSSLVFQEKSKEPLGLEQKQGHKG